MIEFNMLTDDMIHKMLDNSSLVISLRLVPKYESDWHISAFHCIRLASSFVCLIFPS
jgi:hypothetical protein